jgi:hypothetical protein
MQHVRGKCKRLESFDPASISSLMNLARSANSLTSGETGDEAETKAGSPNNPSDQEPTKPDGQMAVNVCWMCCPMISLAPLVEAMAVDLCGVVWGAKVKAQRIAGYHYCSGTRRADHRVQC